METNMKKIFWTAVLWGVCFTAASAATTDTIRDKKSERKEKQEDRKEYLKNESEHLINEGKGAVQDVKRDAIRTYEETKDNLLKTKDDVLQNLKEAKGKAQSWFNENITANTVGEFAERQRQENQLFADHLRSNWNEHSFEITAARLPLMEGSFYVSDMRQKETDTARPLQIRITEIMEPSGRMNAPVPANYTKDAGKQAVSNLVSKQQFIDFKFYGQAVKIYYDPALRNISIGKKHEKGIAKSWQYLSDKEFEPVLFQLYQYKEELRLNDYQYYLLVRQFSDLLFAKSKRGENLLFAVFMLNQTGYDARMAWFQGEGEERLVVLLPFFEEVVLRPYVVLGKNRYYLMDADPGKKLAQCRVKVYPKAHANAKNPVSLRIEPQLNGIAPLYGKFQGYTFDERLAQIQSDMPAGPLQLYAEAPFSPLMHKTFLYKLLPELDSVVRQKQNANLKEQLSLREQQEMKILALNTLLNRVLSAQAKQSAKLPAVSIYPEMMFMKKGAGDILDRSLLLCQISNRILGIPAVLLVYPDFAMAAVAFAEGASLKQSPFAKADYVELDGKKYFLCGKLPKKLNDPAAARVYKW